MNISMESGTQMTLEEFMPEIFQKPSATVSDFHARLSALLDSEEDLKIQEELCSLKSCGLLKKESLKYYSQKMLKDSLIIGGGNTFQTIIYTMAELGYSVEWQVLNSKNFGVPQNRERVFLVGHLGDKCIDKVFPFATDNPKTDSIQGQRSIANCLDTKIAADTRGTYLIVNGGGYCAEGTQGKRLSQGLILHHGHKPRLTDKAKTLDTRIGALPNFSETYVIEYEDQASN